MRSLVTGGAGFIGSHLVEALSTTGSEVIVLDNLSSGSLGNLTEISHDVQFVSGDCKNARDVTSAIEGADIVYHFAANPQTRPDMSDPSTLFSENILATHIVLEAMRHSSARMIVFASTSAVYGEPNLMPTPENYTPLEPISLYGASKLASEALIAACCHMHDKRAVILRLANIVGPRSGHGVITDFVRKLGKNFRELEILGNGNQKKSYLFITDCIGAIFSAVRASSKRVEIFNVGSNDQIRVSRIARIVAMEMGLAGVVLRNSAQGEGRGWIGDVRSMLLDTTKLKSTGWSARFNSEESVRRSAKLLALSAPLSAETTPTS